MHPRDRLRHHVTGAIERGEAVPIIELRPPLWRFRWVCSGLGESHWVATGPHDSFEVSLQTHVDDYLLRISTNPVEVESRVGMLRWNRSGPVPRRLIEDFNAWRTLKHESDMIALRERYGEQVVAEMNFSPPEPVTAGRWDGTRWHADPGA